jgi:formylglycine-generating enzyme required for sulfatase activity
MAEPAFPVVQVTLEDAQAYARWAGRALPTEPEWEYAARGGLANADYSWGNDRQAATTHANHWQGIFPLVDSGEDGFKGPAPVGCFKPNGFGLHDMAGNVWELTETAWDQQKTALGAPPGSTVIKGGSWLCANNFCLRYRPAARQPGDPELPTDHIGFRTVAR